MLAHGLWAAICLGRFAVHGKTIPRKAGGATIPPYHTPVFVLTHYPRPDLAMEGGTIFHFVTDGPEAALARAREAANGKDIRIGGGASVIRQYLTLGLIDEMHLAVSPVLLGSGEHLFGGLDLPNVGYVPGITTPGEGALHVVIRKDVTHSSGKS